MTRAGIHHARHVWVLGALIGALVTRTFADETSDQVATVRPNIVFILADDLGYGELGCYGQSRIHTPNLDRLAAAGARLTQHYAGSPVCAPSRCSLLTGKSSARAQIRDNRDSGQPGPFPGQWPLAAETETFARVLQRAGYATGVFGKWGLGLDDSTGSPLRQGFHEFYGYDCQRLAHSYYPPYLTRGHSRVGINQHPIAAHQQQSTGEINAGDYRGDQYASELIVAEALDFIRQHAGGPFLLYVPLIEPHLAMHPPQEWIDLYPLEWDQEYGPYRGQNGYLPHPRPRAAYAAMISHLDHHVGRILDCLDQLGLTKNTLVVFTSDNGSTHGGRDFRFSVGGAACEFFQSTGGLRGSKGSCYEGGLRVPCIARWPGRIPEGLIVDFPSYSPDWFPTLCEAAGVDNYGQLDGVDLIPVLCGDKTEVQRDVGMAWEFHGYGGWIAARSGDWKLVMKNIATNPHGASELYNLAEDSKEAHNVADGNEEIAARLMVAYQADRIAEPNFPWPFDRDLLPPVRSRDWESLFDGETLAGWTVRGGQATFSVEDGCILGRTAPNSPNTFLCTEAEFGDFILELEFLVDPQLNSGIQIRSQSIPEYRDGVVHGYQVEIDPSDRGWTGGIYDESRRGWLFDLSRNRPARYAFRPGAWNRLRILARGDRLQSWLNGVPAADLRDSQTATGFIALQVHGVGARQVPLHVRFRSIRILRDPLDEELFQESTSDVAQEKIFTDPSKLELVVDGLQFGEGPAVGPDRKVYFSDIPNDRILVHDPATGETSVFMQPSGKANGLYFSPGGRLAMCESETRAVTLFDGANRRVLAERFEERRLNSPNDIVADGSGGWYFTDPRYGDRQSMELDRECVYYINAQGKLSLVLDSLSRPNGIEMSPDGRHLYVADHAAGRIWVYDVPQPGHLENGRQFAGIGSDGMTVDRFGNLYVTWQRDVIVFAPDGRELDRLTMPAPPTNCILHGPTLYITTPHALYRLP